MSLAQQNGVTGTAEPTATEEPAPRPRCTPRLWRSSRPGDLDGA
ncbi:hypothetical protein QJS66_00350 [Kocuria rhizophila]|nr:hypothetical protein QJS66_00350 [Kocuria rhizophila]